MGVSGACCQGGRLSEAPVLGWRVVVWVTGCSMEGVKHVKRGVLKAKLGGLY